jgi:hypothetical protein
LIVEKWVVEIYGLNWLRMDPVSRICDHSEYSHSVKLLMLLIIRIMMSTVQVKP